MNSQSEDNNNDHPKGSGKKVTVNLKSKALHIDRKDFEIKINESKKHYSKLIYDEIRKGKEISWHINETFEFDIIQTVDKLDSNNKYYQLDCKFCEVTISANDLDHNFQNYFKFHCQRAGHKLKIERTIMRQRNGWRRIEPLTTQT